AGRGSWGAPRPRARADAAADAAGEHLRAGPDFREEPRRGHHGVPQRGFERGLARLLGDAPLGAAGRVHDLDAEGAELAADLVGVGEVLGLAGGVALGEAGLDGGGVDAALGGEAGAARVEERARLAAEEAERAGAGVAEVAGEAGERAAPHVLGDGARIV